MKTFLWLFAATLLFPGQDSPVRNLTMEERVAAQAAIQRVYYSHQAGSKRPFEEAVPRAALMSQVEDYLRKSAALQVNGRIELTPRMLASELERMRRETQKPGRLRELFAALDNDPFVIQETLVRQTLVNRLLRDSFAQDRSYHTKAFQEAEASRAAIRSGVIDPFAEGLHRAVLEIGPAEFDRWLRRVPGGPGSVGEIIEERDAFVFYVLLERSDRDTSHARFAEYSFPKQSWDSWWRSEATRFDRSSIRPVAHDLDGTAIEITERLSALQRMDEPRTGLGSLASGVRTRPCGQARP